MTTTTEQPPTTKPLRVIDGLGAPTPAYRAGHGSLDLDKRTYDRALDCVHCGLCLPACPTYTENGLEADSPRGRIYLMKGLADGKIEPTASVLEHLDLCLDCRACETACPSGVQYHELIEATRAAFTHHPPPAAATKPKTFVDELVDAMFYKVFPYSLRLKLALLPARLMQKLGLWKLATKLTKLMPLRVRKMQQMLPPSGPLWEKSLAEFYPANKANCPDGKPRATVAMLAGCVGSVLFQHVNRQTIELLQLAGCDCLVPKAQQCCGAIHHHGGQTHEAEAFVRANVEAFLGEGTEGRRDEGTKGGETLYDSDSLCSSVPPFLRPFPDFILTNIAGCGAQLKDYGLFTRDDPAFASRGATFAAKVRDISQVLVELAPPRPTREMKMTVTYHDACHLAHAQRVTDPPRRLLSWIPGLKVIPLVESDMCCGAAGTYNLSQPEMAMQLAERKIRHIQATGATTCVTGNVGCAMQIQSEAQRLGVELKVMHPVSLLHEAYFGAGREATD
ncbi:MAG: heterodisulfide reductase-related iron-sulfur binding cluster [Phycisphaeraceae bacterium]